MKNISILENIVPFFQQKKRVGFSLKEIHVIEKNIGFTLPKALKEYLLLDANMVLLYHHEWTFKELHEAFYEEYCEAFDEVPDFLFFVINEQNVYVKGDEGDNPPVYVLFYDGFVKKYMIKKLFPSFKDLVESILYKRFGFRT